MDPIIAIRFVHYGVAMLLFGGIAFERFVAPPAIRSSLGGRRSLDVMLALLALLTALLWLAAETANIGNGWHDALDPTTVWSVLTETPFGQVWIWRIALALMLVPAWFMQSGAARWVQLTLAALLLASLALVGHAAMDEGAAGLFHTANDAVHLLAAGFWLGALPPLVICLRVTRSDLRTPAVAALQRFSGLGHFAVALILVTGVANALLIMGHGGPSLSRYWILLGLKIVLVVAMVGVALVNRYRHLARLGDEGDATLSALRRGTVAEIALGAGVVALVSAFGTYDPA